MPSIHSSYLYCQEPIFLHYDVSNNLPGNIVYCSAQDESGLMWFGTDKGLACFDGVRFITYGLNEGLPDPEVLDLMLDSEGRLWISCFRKRPCYRYKGKIYTEAQDPQLSKINISTAIFKCYEEKGKGIWIVGNTNKIYFYNKDGSDVSEIQVLDKGSIKGIGKINNKIFALEERFFLVLDNSKVVDTIFLDKRFADLYFQGGAFSENQIIVSNSKYTEIFKFKNNKINIVSRLENIGGRVYIDKGEDFWISLSTGGALEIDSDGNKKHYLKHKKINTVFEDNSKGIWFCTSGEGIYYLPFKYSSLYSDPLILESMNITAISEYSGSILFADDESNLYRIKRGNILKESSILNDGLNRTRTLLVDKNSIIVATDRGVYSIMNGKKQLFKKSPSAKYVVRSDSGEYIIGHSSKVLQYKSPDDDGIVIFNSRSTAAKFDKNNNLWIGCVDGLYSNIDRFDTNWGDIYSCLKSRVTSICNYSDSCILVSNVEHGLIYVYVNKKGVYKTIKANEEIKETVNNIQSIFVDSIGAIWLATNSGVYRIFNKIVTQFNRNNGLPENDVNAVIACNDTIWIATVAGLCKLTIDTMKLQEPFITLISAIAYKNKNHEFSQRFIDYPDIHNNTICLDPNSNSIEIFMSGLDYASGGKMSYSVIKTSILPSIEQITFGNLYEYIYYGFKPRQDTTIINSNSINLGTDVNPGYYKFTVYAISPSGNYSSQPAYLIVQKLPFWHDTFWFYSIIWAMTIFLLWKISSALNENKLLHSKVSELTLMTIKSQINPHFIGNSINAIQQFFYPPDPVSASKYIETITRLLRSTMIHSEASFVSMNEEMQYNEDYLKMIKLRFNDKFSYSIHTDESISPNTRFPTMIIQPILENATIHGLSPDGNSYVEISIKKLNDGRVICRITDNGIGIKKHQFQKKNKSPEHQSRGIKLIQDKIKILNDLYNINAYLSFDDLSELDVNKRGTSVELSFNP